MIEHALPGAAEQMEQDTGTFFDTDIPALLAWTFGAEDVVLAGADHSLALTHPTEIAAALVAFLRRHPIPG